MDSPGLIPVFRELSLLEHASIITIKQFDSQNNPYVESVSLDWFYTNIVELRAVTQYINDFTELVDAITHRKPFINYRNLSLLDYCGITPLIKRGFDDGSIDSKVPTNEVLMVQELTLYLEAAIKYELLKHKIRGDVFVDLDSTEDELACAYSIDLFVLRTIDNKRHNLHVRKFGVS